MRSNMTWAGLVVTLLGLSACNLGGDDSAAGTTERARPADCEPPRSRANGGADGEGDGAGDTAGAVTSGPQTLRFDGEDRPYLLALPDGYDGTTAHPLLLSLHGWGSSKEEFDELTGFAERGTARGYVVVTPDARGEPPEWNMFEQQGRADDYGFVDALVEDLTGRLCIDPARIYAAGLSAGSAFTGFVACREPYRFAAVAMVAAFIPTTCEAARAGPSVVAIHGTADPVVPYQGGQVAGGGTGIPAALDTFARYGEDYGCGEPVVEDGPVAGVERRRLRDCSGGRDVVLYSVNDGGHEWPGATGTALAAAGEQLFATDTILDFFDQHVKPTP